MALTPFTKDAFPPAAGEDARRLPQQSAARPIIPGVPLGALLRSAAPDTAARHRRRIVFLAVNVLSSCPKAFLRYLISLDSCLVF